MRPLPLALAAALLAAPLAAGTGVQLLGGSFAPANLYQGVLEAGEVDRYPDPVGQLVWWCMFPIGAISQLYLVVEGEMGEGLVTLWTWEQNEWGRVVRTPHPAEGVPPRASARTYDHSAGCPVFEVEAGEMGRPTAYTILRCPVGQCPDNLP